MSSPSPPALQQLRRLDRSSPDFQDKLCNVLYGQDYVESLPNLRGGDVVWLVDYLDEVCRRVALPCSPLKPAQALGGLDPGSTAARRCLRELRNICGASAILPTSYTLPSHLLNIDHDPFDSGGFGDVYKGTLGDSRVCIKRVRMYSKDGSQGAAKVRYCRRRFPCLSSPINYTDLLPRGRNLEAFNPPKYPTPPRYNLHAPSTRFELDVWWGPTGIYRKEHRCRPARACRFPCCCALSHAYSCYQLSDVASGLDYLHSCNVVHGDLKGVRSFINILPPY